MTLRNPRRAFQSSECLISNYNELYVRAYGLYLKQHDSVYASNKSIFQCKIFKQSTYVYVSLSAMANFCWILYYFQVRLRKCDLPCLIASKEN